MEVESVVAHHALETDVAEEYAGPETTTAFEEESETQQIVVVHTTPNLPRLTPTGKISHAKTRVYTQRYRKEWEQMQDFRGWLTEVPHEPTRAYCLYCKKNLHAHRLSLLKHMCTMKHQRASLIYKSEKKLVNQKGRNISYEQFKEESYEEIKDFENLEDGEVEQMDGMEFVVHRLDEEYQYGVHCNDESNVVEVYDDESYQQEDKVEGVKLETEMKITEVHSEYLNECNDGVGMEMIETEDGNTISYSTANDQTMIENVNQSEEEFNSAVQSGLTDDEFSEYSESEEMEKDENKSASIKLDESEDHSSKEMVVITSSGNTIAFNKTNIKPKIQYMLSKMKSKTRPVVSTINKSLCNPVPILPKPSGAFQAGISERSQTKGYLKRTIKSKPNITTHVLDTTKGTPVSGLQVSLYKLLDSRWTFINESTTSASGHCTDLVPCNEKSLTTGRYKLHFDVDKYFTLRKIETNYPFIEIVFDIKNGVRNYHVPLLLSPFCYLTYGATER